MSEFPNETENQEFIDSFNQDSDEEDDEDDEDEDDENDEDWQEENISSVPTIFQRPGRKHMNQLPLKEMLLEEQNGFMTNLKTEGILNSGIQTIISRTRKFLAFKDRMQEYAPLENGFNQKVI
jgi:hypothetical protein